jgi:hypothetical protein
MMKRLAMMILCGAVAFAAGCSTRIKFPTGAPNETIWMMDEAAVVSLPDSLEDREYKVSVGSLWEAHKFKIPLHDVYRTEAYARLSPLFTRGVTMTTHEVLDEIQGRYAAEDEALPDEEATDEKDATDKKSKAKSKAKDSKDPKATDAKAGDAESKDSVPGSELEKVLAELEKKEEGEKVSKTQAELMDQALREAEIETYEQRGAVYLVRFQDALYGMPDERVAVSFRVQLIDRRTNAILLDKRYGGRSQRFNPNKNNKTNEDRLIYLTKLALSKPMGQLVEDIAKVTGTWKPTT